MLCHDPRCDPVGVCRMCVVDVGGRVLAAACVRPCENGMEVKTGHAKVERQRKVLTELLMADQPRRATRRRRPPATTCSSTLARRYDDRPCRAAPAGARPRAATTRTRSSAVDHDACILCDRCIRACDDIQSNDVIGRTGKGYATRIAFDLDNPMGESTCVDVRRVRGRVPDRRARQQGDHDVPIRPREELKAVDSVCPYCGVGCALTYHVDEERGAIVVRRRAARSRATRGGSA